MIKPILQIAALIALSNCSAYAEDSTIKEDAKKAGEKTGEVVHQIGETGKEVGKKVVKTARDVGHATRDGAKEFHKAVTGKNRKQSTRNSSRSSVANSTSASSVNK